MFNPLAPKLLAELIGTFAFVFIGAGAAAILDQGVGLRGIATIAFAHGLTIMVFVFAYGAVSGGISTPRSRSACSRPGPCALAKRSAISSANSLAVSSAPFC